jgi:hypothetical protein
MPKTAAWSFVFGQPSTAGWFIRFYRWGATVRSAASSNVVRHYGGATSDESQVLVEIWVISTRENHMWLEYAWNMLSQKISKSCQKLECHMNVMNIHEIPVYLNVN